MNITSTKNYSFFSDYDMRNLFVLASLNARSIFLTQFDNEFKRINFIEKILIGERIRDLKYLSDFKMLVMSYDEEGKIGVLQQSQDITTED